MLAIRLKKLFYLIFSFDFSVYKNFILYGLVPSYEHRSFISRIEKPDLIIMGKQAIDDDMNATGQMLSALLNWSLATFASNVEINDKNVRVSREVDGGIEHIEVNLPTIITTDLRLNEPRYASLPNIMKAKKKPINEIDVSNLNLNLDPKLEILKVEEPKSRDGGIIVKSVDDLINKLKNEAKVI